MKFLKDIKQAFQEGYNESVRENDREERMINELKKKPVTSTEAREVFMKLKKKNWMKSLWIGLNLTILF